MLSSKGLKEIVTIVRPIIERQLDDAEQIAAFRDKVADSGGDWSALKALIKAQIQDERDETGDGKRVKKILEKAGFSTGYAELLGWSNMNEKNFSADDDFDPITGEFVDDNEASDGSPSVSSSLTTREAEESVVTHSPETANEACRASKGAAPVAGRPAEPANSLPTEGCGYAHTEGNATQSGVTAGEVRAAANAGGDDVDGGALRANRDENGEGAASTLPSKPKHRLRPNCLDRSNCKSGSVDHCWSCKKAMADKSEVAA